MCSASWSCYINCWSLWSAGCWDWWGMLESARMFLCAGCIQGRWCCKPVDVCVGCHVRGASHEGICGVAVGCYGCCHRASFKKSNWMFKHKRPHLSGNYLRPSSHGIDEHCECAIGDNTNVALNNSILPMCADTTKGMTWTVSIKMLHKFCRGKNSIIRMNMLDVNVITRGKSFKSLFWFNGLPGISMFLQMAIEELAVVISPERAVAILAAGGSSNMKWNMTTIPATIWSTETNAQGLKNDQQVPCWMRGAIVYELGHISKLNKLELDNVQGMASYHIYLHEPSSGCCKNQHDQNSDELAEDRAAC